MERNMNLTVLKDTITKRRSHRSYTENRLSDATLATIESTFGELVPLFPNIKYSLRLVEREELRTTMRWFPPMAIALFSEVEEGYLENAGFILGQLDLYLQSTGLGACFVGMGKPLDITTMPDNMEFVMLLAFGESLDAMRSGEKDFARLDISEVTDIPDAATALAGLAPSSLNSQPWYFTKTDRRTYRVFRKELVRSRNITRMNMIDVGIAASYLFIAALGIRRAFREEKPTKMSGKQYLFTIEV